MVEIRYSGQKFRSAATGTVTDGEIADVDASVARDYVAEHGFEYVNEEAEEQADELQTLYGVGDDKAAALREHGFETLDSVESASAEELAEVPGVSEEVAEDYHRQLE